MRRFLALSMAVLVGGAAAAKDVRNQSLEGAVSLLAKDVKDGLGDAKPEVAFGSFAAHEEADAAADSNAAPEVVRALTEALKALGVTVVRGRANFNVSCKFKEQEDGPTSLQLVQLTLLLTNKETGKKTEYAQQVTNQVAVQRFLGLSNEAPPGAGPRERNKAFKAAVDDRIPSTKDKPRPAPKPTLIDGTIARPAAGSHFGIEVSAAALKADPKEPHAAGDYTVVTPTDDRGLAYVKIDRGHVYGVWIHNTADFDAAVSLTVDGLSMFVACDKEDPGSKKPLRDTDGKPLHNFVVVEKGKKVFIQGWFVNMKETDEFLVTEYAKSLSSQFQAPTSQVGVITCCFHAAVPKDQPFPAGEPTDPDEFSQSADGTGKGARVQSPYEAVERKIGLLRATVSVRYSK